MALPHDVSLPDALHGPRVRLRPLGQDDAAALWEAINESRDHLAPWLPWVRHVQALADAQAHVARARTRWRRGTDLAMGIFARDEGHLLGGCTLYPHTWALRVFEIGYWLRRTATGHGYAAETVQVLTRFAFEELKANRVEIRVDPRNAKSRAVAERIGFVYEGTLRRCAPGADGKPADRMVYALIADDDQRPDWANDGENKIGTATKPSARSGDLPSPL